MVSYMPRTLYPREKGVRYPLGRRLDGPKSQSGRHGEVKILATPGHELRPFRPSARSQSLYRLSSPEKLNNSAITAWELKDDDDDDDDDITYINYSKVKLCLWSIRDAARYKA
jgi:hypothetical protein